ncbi:MAG: lytic transglycosylase domain-containing protein [Candidatus Carbobacillus sp.]|nr:lytic transglycosylase domain-containing protein [Candidatus Carbobacillus sp.]
MAFRGSFWRGIFAFILALILLAFMKSALLWQWLYPIYYPDSLKRSAETNQVDPLLVVAIIQTESGFTPNSASRKGARGIMQIMEDTEQWIRSQKGMAERLYQMSETEANIELGSWYIRHLLDRYDGSLVQALAAYNAGPTAVDRWIRGGLWQGTYETLYQIPYGETRHYITRVLYLLHRYHTLYPDISRWAYHPSFFIHVMHKP